MISGAGAMNPVCPREDGRLEWGNGVVSMLFDTAGDSPVRLCNVAGRGMGPIGGRVTDDGRTVLERDPRPIVEVRAANTGSQDNRLTLIATVAAAYCDSSRPPLPSRRKGPPNHIVWRSSNSLRMRNWSRTGAHATTCSAVYVGDTAMDQEAAQKAGVPFLHAAYGFGDVTGAPEITQFPQLLELLQD